MDYLIEKVPAPNLQALFAKIEMAHSRSADFVSMFDDHQNGIATDHNSSSICLRPIMGVSQGASAKYRLADPPQRGSFLAGDTEIAGHPHRKAPETPTLMRTVTQ